MNYVENNPKLDIYRKKTKLRFKIYFSLEIAIYLATIISFILIAIFNYQTIEMLTKTLIASTIATAVLSIFLPIRDVIEKRMLFGVRPFVKKYFIYYYGYLCSLIMLIFIRVGFYAYQSIITPDYFFIYWLIHFILYVVGTIIVAFIINWNYNPKVLIYRYKKERKKENE